MQTEMIDFSIAEGTAPGFIARPDTDAPAPGVVVIQEWWGLNDNIKDIARRLAGEGFVALAPDLYHGVVTTEPDDARKQAMSLDRQRAASEIHGAVAFLKAQPYVQPKNIGVMGFCMGGGLTLWMAAKNPDVGAAIAFYGGGAPQPEEFAESRAAVLNILGEGDHPDLIESIRAVDNYLGEKGNAHELVIYSGAQHAFFNDTRPHIYHPEAAADAWSRTLNWLRKYL
jgi:carboxymethylenebutenolidase